MEAQNGRRLSWWLPPCAGRASYAAAAKVWRVFPNWKRPVSEIAIVVVRQWSILTAKLVGLHAHATQTERMELRSTCPRPTLFSLLHRSRLRARLLHPHTRTSHRRNPGKSTSRRGCLRSEHRSCSSQRADTMPFGIRETSNMQGPLSRTTSWI